MASVEWDTVSAVLIAYLNKVGLLNHSADFPCCRCTRLSLLCATELPKAFLPRFEIVVRLKGAER